MAAAISQRRSVILCIAVLAITSGCKSFASVEAYGKDHQERLSDFLALPQGIPSADTIRRYLQRIQSDLFSHCLNECVGVYDKPVTNISLDGKTMRGSRSEDQKGQHVLSVFNTDDREVVDQITIPDKQNEITASKQLLSLLCLEGVTVRADAMMCQTSIASLIHEKGGDYCFPVKANQPGLLENVETFFNIQQNCYSEVCRPEKGHGRIETRTYRFSTAIEDIDPEKKWKGLAAVGCVIKTVEEKGTTSNETQYYICSFTDIERFKKVQRQHWRIESMHWDLDVVFNEDACRVKKGFAPSNLNILRKVALCSLQKAKDAAHRYSSRLACRRLSRQSGK